MEAVPVETIAESSYRLLLAGKTKEEIAEQLKITPQRVVDVINSRMKTEASMITSEERNGLIQLQMDRYNALLAAHWQAATFGDFKSTELVLKTMAEMNKLNRLGDLDPEANKSAVLVIRGEEENYIKALMAAEEG